MKRILVLALIAVAATAAGAPASFAIDPDHSAAHFTVRHLAISNVRGEFGHVRGTIVFDDADPASTRIDATIDAASVNTRVAARDEDLRGASFFDVAKYPEILFRSTSVRAAGDNRYSVTGDLTLHGVTRSVTLDVEATPPAKDSRGNERRGAEATTTLSRKEFGVSGSPGMVGDEVKVTIDIEAFRKTN
ncbi:MAG TPA: YceI family protein [Thermoanaerobaculia bacterium]|nr:YceI family protein [Thermoanaerobaculia bacterium]